jgi:hypothetical protein
MELVQYLEQVAGSKVEEPKPPKPKKTMIKKAAEYDQHVLDKAISSALTKYNSLDKYTITTAWARNFLTILVHRLTIRSSVFIRLSGKTPENVWCLEEVCFMMA